MSIKKILKGVSFVRAVTIGVNNHVSPAHRSYGEVEIHFHRTNYTFFGEKRRSRNSRTYLRASAKKYVEKLRMMGTRCYPFGFWGDHSENWLLQFYTKSYLDVASKLLDNALILFLLWLVLK